jgi:hypothetical protein
LQNEGKNPILRDVNQISFLRDVKRDNSLRKKTLHRKKKAEWVKGHSEKKKGEGRGARADEAPGGENVNDWGRRLLSGPRPTRRCASDVSRGGGDEARPPT